MINSEQSRKANKIKFSVQFILNPSLTVLIKTFLSDPSKSSKDHSSGVDKQQSKLCWLHLFKINLNSAKNKWGQIDKSMLEYRASHFLFVLSIELKDPRDNLKFNYMAKKEKKIKKLSETIKHLFPYFSYPKPTKQTKIQPNTQAHRRKTTKTTERATVIILWHTATKKIWNNSTHPFNNTAVIIH